MGGGPGDGHNRLYSSFASIYIKEVLHKRYVKREARTCTYVRLADAACVNHSAEEFAEIFAFFCQIIRFSLKI